MSTSSNATEAPVGQRIVHDALVLTIRRQHAGNSIDTSTARALTAALRQHRKPSGLRAVVITGEGDKFFCSGGDLKAYRALRTKAQLAAAFGTVRKLLDDIEAFPLPVIAAINGYAIGGGMELSLACDLRFASDHAKLGFAQARLSLIPGWNGVQRLVELVGRGTAFKLLATAETLDVQAALGLGLIDAAPDGRPALDQALAFAARLAEVAPLSLGATKAAVLAALRMAAKSSAAAAAREFERLWFTRDHREAEAAFVEKRKPVFSGK